jgi:hypothetical protein
VIYWLDEPRRQQALAARRRFGLTLVLSLLVHIVALVVVVQRTPIVWPDHGADAVSDRLQVRLSATPPPAPSPVPAPEPPPRRTTIASAPSPSARMRAQPPPPLLASQLEAPRVVTPSESPAPPSRSRETRPIEGDLWSYIQARRRERGAPAESALSDSGRNLNAQLAANLPRPATGTATQDMNHGGGIFEIKRMTYDDAAFLFFGWNKDMGRRTPQLITVRIGNNPDMRMAVVRSMIAVIRQYTQEDFLWRSARRDDNVTLSARPADNTALETYLLREFFDDRGEPH